MGCMFTSLKVVSIAVSLFTATKRSATFLRSIDIFLRVVPLVPSSGIVPIDGTAFTASSLVILPAFPVPVIEDASMSFSAKIFLAAGDAVPVAYVVATSFFTGVAFGASLTEVEVGVADDPSGFSAAVSIKQTTAPTSTASPSSACKVIVPLSSAGNSKVALSESTSAIGWSFST